MYLLFEAHFAQRFTPESHHIWNKLLNLILFLAKVFFLSVFTGNSIRQKYHRSFSLKKGTWSFRPDERVHMAQKSIGGAPLAWARHHGPFGPRLSSRHPSSRDALYNPKNLP
jgi:hypothetical protein